MLKMGGVVPGKAELISTYAPLYLKVSHNLLNALFNTLQYQKFIDELEEVGSLPRSV